MLLHNHRGLFYSIRKIPLCAVRRERQVDGAATSSSASTTRCQVGWARCHYCGQSVVLNLHEPDAHATCALACVIRSQQEAMHSWRGIVRRLSAAMRLL